MKKFILALYVALIQLCMSIPAYSQLVEEWSKTFTFDEILHSLNYPKFKFDSQENLIVVGGQYLIKYDSLGNELWWRELDGNAFYPDPGDGHDHFVIDDDDYIYIAYNQYTYSSNNDTLFTSVGISKFDANGEEIWSSGYSYYEYNLRDMVASITLASNKVYITGIADALTDCAVFLVCFDANSGAENWRTINNDLPADCDRGNRVQTDFNGNVFVGGKSYATAGGNEYYLLKYDSLGNFIWKQRFRNDTLGNTLLSDMTITSLGDIVMTGNYYTTVSVLQNGQIKWTSAPPSYLPSHMAGDFAIDIVSQEEGTVILTGRHSKYVNDTLETDVLTIKYDDQGNQIWSSRFQENNLISPDRGRVLDVSTTESVYVGGTFQEFSGVHNEHFLILKYNKDNGVLNWSFSDLSNISQREILYSLKVSTDHSIYAIGMAGENVGFSTKFILKKYREVVSSASHHGIGQNEISIFPNPVTNQKMYIYSLKYSGINVDVEIYCSTGRKIAAIAQYQIGVPIEMQELTKGIYFFKFCFDNHIVTKKVVIL